MRSISILHCSCLLEFFMLSCVFTQSDLLVSHITSATARSMAILDEFLADFDETPGAGSGLGNDNDEIIKKKPAANDTDEHDTNAAGDDEPKKK